MDVVDMLVVGAVGIDVGGVGNMVRWLAEGSE